MCDLGNVENIGWAVISKDEFGELSVERISQAVRLRQKDHVNKTDATIQIRITDIGKIVERLLRGNH